MPIPIKALLNHSTDSVDSIVECGKVDEEHDGSVPWLTITQWKLYELHIERMPKIDGHIYDVREHISFSTFYIALDNAKASPVSY